MQFTRLEEGSSGRRVTGHMLFSAPLLLTPTHNDDQINGY